MNSNREELQAAFGADDRARADYERWQRRKARYVRKDVASDTLIYKRHDDALCDDSTGADPQPVTDDRAGRDEQQAADPWDRWNRWADGRIAAYVNANLERGLFELADEVGTITGRVERDCAAKLQNCARTLKRNDS